MNVRQIGERVLVIGGQEIEFRQKILRFLPLEDRVIVLLNPDDFEFGDPMVGRNILAYDGSGELIWRVADHGLKRPSRRKAPEAFFNIGMPDDSTINAVAASCIFKLDPETGALSDPRFRYPGM